MPEVVDTVERGLKDKSLAVRRRDGEIKEEGGRWRTGRDGEIKQEDGGEVKAASGGTELLIKGIMFTHPQLLRFTQQHIVDEYLMTMHLENWTLKDIFCTTISLFIIYYYP